MNSLLAFLNSSGLLHNALISPLLLIVADFFTGLGSSLKNQNFSFGRLSDILGHRSDLLKYAVGALALTAANGLHILSPELNTLLGGVGSGVLDISILTSIITNISEFFPPSVQPEVRALGTEFVQALQGDLTPVEATPTPTPLAQPVVASTPDPAAQPTTVVPSIDLSGGTAVVPQGQFIKMPSGLVPA